MLNSDIIEELVKKYINDRQTVAFGTADLAETFLKKLALRIEHENLQISVIPTSVKIAALMHEFALQSASINDANPDVAFEFVEQVDEHYNYIKRSTNSLVRDKMIAQFANVLVVIARKEDFVKKLHGEIPFEVCPFGWKRTLLQLQTLGRAKLRKVKELPFKTESGNYLIDVEVDEIYSHEDLDYQGRKIPGVLETGLFIGYADRILLHNHAIEVKSRLA